MKNKTLWIMLGAFVLRVWGIADAPLWYDESYSYLVARLPFDQMMEAILGDVHPPLYYWLIAPVAQAGIPWLIRVPSLILSMATLWVWKDVLAALPLPKQTQTIALGLMAVIPTQIWYAQEGRMYALLGFLALAGYRAMQTGRWKTLAGLAAAMLYTHNWAMFYLPSIWAAGLLTRRADWRPLTAALAAAGLSWLPWVGALLGQMAGLERGYWLSLPNVGNVGILFVSLLGGFIWPALAGVPLIIGSVSLLLASPIIQRPAAQVAIMALGPVALSIVASFLWQPVLIFRGAIGSAPWLYLLLAPALARPGWVRWLAAAIILPGILIGQGNIYANSYTIKGGDVIDAYTAAIPAGATVTHSADDGWISAEANLPGRNQNIMVEPCGYNRGGISERTRAGLGTPYIPAQAVTGYLFLSLNPQMDTCYWDTARQMLAQTPAPLADLRMHPQAEGILIRSLYNLP